jgi:hypothetical protein
MRTYKRIFWLSTVLSAFILSVTLFLEFCIPKLIAEDSGYYLHHSFYVDLSIGILASALLVCLTALSSYFAQRKEVVNEIWLADTIYNSRVVAFINKNGNLCLDTLDSTIRINILNDILNLQVELSTNALLQSKYQAIFTNTDMKKHLVKLKADLDKFHVALSRIQRTLLPVEINEKVNFDEAIASLRILLPLESEINKNLGWIAKKNGIKVERYAFVRGETG